MNDPGLDEPIERIDGEVQQSLAHQNDTAHPTANNTRPFYRLENEDWGSFVMPARWWYASTAFPLIAGTFGPMANAFSICALVEYWRESATSDQNSLEATRIPDPHWLTAVNAVSLVLALIANLSLLLNMARRIPFSVAQPITILGFWLASALLIALVAVVPRKLIDHDVQDQVLSQAYYYAIFAAVLYQLVSYLMCVTVWGAFQGHYPKEFELSASQRTLMLQTISFLLWQHLGALAYCHIEGWRFLDAVFWADFTLLTVGIGDELVPTTHLGRSILFPYAIGGIIVLGLVVGSIRSLVLERGEKKMAARLTEKTRLRVVKRVMHAQEGRTSSRRPTVRTLDRDIASRLTEDPNCDTQAEEQRRRAEFAAMRKVQHLAEKERRYVALLFSCFAFAFLWFVGALIFWITEKKVQGWSYFDALYFSYTSLTTIGYGDLEPQSNAGRPFFVFWSLLAVPTLTILISNMGDTVVKGVRDVTLWIGDVTVLPHEEHSIKTRFRYGLWRITGGLISQNSKTRKLEKDIEQKADDNSDINMKNEEDDGSDDDGNASGSSADNIHELQGGIRPLGHDRDAREKKRRARQERQTSERLTRDFEQLEATEEQDAKDRGDKVAEIGHHYRRLLIQSLRKCYQDSREPTPKHYTYEEWAYFLKLLGHDEGDATHHKRMQPRRNEYRTGRHSGDDGERPGYYRFASATSATQENVGPLKKWSWMGVRSPLNASSNEPLWLVARLFERLEESLNHENVAKEERILAMLAGRKGSRALSRAVEQARSGSSSSGTKVAEEGKKRDEPDEKDETDEKDEDDDTKDK